MTKAPFNEQLSGVAAGFAKLLRTIVETIDQRGLKKRYLRKHKRDVSALFHELRKATLTDDTAIEFVEERGEALYLSRPRQCSMEQQQCRACARRFHQAAQRNGDKYTQGHQGIRHSGRCSADAQVPQYRFPWVPFGAL